MLGLHAPGEHLDRPALVEDGRTWSHRELWEIARLHAHAFRADEKGLVFLFCRNTPGTVLAMLAAHEAGQASALLDGSLSATMREDLLARYRPEWLVDAADAHPPPGYHRLHDFEDVTVFHRARGGGAVHRDLAILLSTSGSTGSPKLVRLSEHAVVSNARSIAQALALGPDERAIASLPLHYSYGLSVLNSHLLVGGSVVLTPDSPVQRSFWETFDREACTSFAAVPYGYQVLQRVGVESMALPSLRNLTQAGGKLAPELVERFHRWIAGRGGQFWVMYGQTEATARIAVLPAHRLPEKLGACGQAIPGGTLLVDAGDGPETTPGLVGEVVYRGPNVMMGYALQREDLARGDELAGELRTGDLGSLDEEGFLTISGRSSRIGKVFGLRVNLDEVEALLRPHGPTAVVAGHDELLVFCEWGDDDAFHEEALRLAERLRIHRRAFAFSRVGSLPLTASGKIDYQRLA